MRTRSTALGLVAGLCLLGGCASLAYGGVADTPLPTFSDGKPAVLAVVIPTVVKNNQVESVVLCTNFASAAVDVGLEVFDQTGTRGNSIAAGNGALLGVTPGRTVTIATGATALLHEDAVVTLEAPVTGLRNGSARVVATSPAVGCAALAVDKLHTIADPATCPTCQPPSLAALPVSTSSPIGPAPTPTSSATASTPTSTGPARTPTSSTTPTSTGPMPTSSATASTPTSTGPARTPTRTATPIPTPDPKAAKKCEKAITKAGVKFVGKKLRALGRCVRGVLTCIETKEDADPKRQECIDKARVKCTGELAKIVDAGGAAENLKAGIGKACNERLISNADVRSDDGLGYGRLIGEPGVSACAALTDIASIAACVAQQHECQAEKLFAVQEPRAVELITQAGVTGLGQLSCLTGNGGSGQGVGDTKLGKVIVRCEVTIQNTATTFAIEKLKSLQKCVQAIFTCQHTKQTQSKRDACVTDKAQKVCDHEFTKMRAQAGKLDRAVDKACDPQISGVSYASLSQPTAANLAAPAMECAMFGVANLDSYPNYKLCLSRQHACRVEDLVRFEAPRAEELLALVHRSPLRSSFCP